MPDESEKLKAFWGMWERGWNRPPAEDPVWQLFNQVETSLPLPTYYVFPPSARDTRYVVALAKSASTRTYDRQVIQPRWDGFWKAVSWKISEHRKLHPPDDALLVYFDQGLSFELRQKLRDQPDDAMAALADDDLRFGEVGRFGSDALSAVQTVLDDWLRHQETRNVAQKKQPGGERSGRYIRLLTLFSREPGLAKQIREMRGRGGATLCREALKKAKLKVHGDSRDKSSIAICRRAAKSAAKSRK